MKKFSISEPIEDVLFQSKPLHVNTHPFMLKPWLKLHSFARKHSMCKFEDDILTGADKLNFETKDFTESKMEILNEFDKNKL
jgi:hypothetical protein